MWSPEDEHSIPTSQERIRATEALDLLQIEITQTLARADELQLELKTTRAKVEQLRHQAAVRKAWLAPIRRVPDEILSLIFIETCRQVWKAPLRLGAVCRRWRLILVATPRAWALIRHDHRFNAQMLDLWLSRCGVVGVHVSLSPGAEFIEAKTVCEHNANIQCLSLFGHSDLLLGSFPYLERLQLGLGDFYHSVKVCRSFHMGFSDIKLPKKQGDVCILDLERFPKLVNLHLHSPSNPTMHAISLAKGFPPLQKLHIHVCSTQWLDIVRNCAGSLLTLVVEYPLDHCSLLQVEKGNEGISLPQLQHLHYIFKDNEDLTIMRVPLLHTPHLQSYHEYSKYESASSSPQHQDVASVTHLILERRGLVQLDKFPNLTTFKLVARAHGMLGILSKLASNALLCPNLTSLDWVSIGWGEDAETEAGQYLDNRRTLVGKTIKFSCNHSAGDHKVGYAACYTLCDCDLPQNTNHPDYYNEERHIGDDDDEDIEEEEMYHGYMEDNYEYDDEDEDEMSRSDLEYYIYRS